MILCTCKIKEIIAVNFVGDVRVCLEHLKEKREKMTRIATSFLRLSHKGSELRIAVEIKSSRHI